MTASFRHRPAHNYDVLDRPYFVYGTLRPEHGNSQSWRWHDATCLYDGEAVVDGYAMIVKDISFGIPYAVQMSGHRVVGALIVPPDDETQQVWLRESLDSLESCPSFYDRLVTDVTTPDGVVEAWIYTPTEWSPAGRIVASGNFDDS